MKNLKYDSPSNVVGFRLIEKFENSWRWIEKSKFVTPTVKLTVVQTHLLI
uniref:Uncharacterized protein n=1 Tax=Medicago truncatula TaxID=3880 RepID=A2Q3I3_MEDTR|nr:hypothetical protein MtrDRAFT_AC155882g28v2 [Medicago truncatula]ABN09009.1 hypothetical protein MtrDRAFT_AC172101g1v1 [Medicago truncatula]